MDDNIHIKAKELLQLTSAAKLDESHSAWKNRYLQGRVVRGLRSITGRRQSGAAPTSLPTFRIEVVAPRSHAPRHGGRLVAHEHPATNSTVASRMCGWVDVNAERFLNMHSLIHGGFGPPRFWPPKSQPISSLRLLRCIDNALRWF
jgi:hypothetical protein